MTTAAAPINPHMMEGAPLAQAILAVTLPQPIRERARQHPNQIALVFSTWKAGGQVWRAAAVAVGGQCECPAYRR